MNKMKTHQGISKRFKQTKPLKGKSKLIRQGKGRGSKHLKTKQSNKRKNRIKQPVFVSSSETAKNIMRAINR